MAYIGQSLTEGTRRVYTYVATASQTTFNAVYTVGAIDVHQNGVLLAPTDYTATDGTTVVLGSGAAANDEITITCHNTFSVADTVSSSQGGTFSGNIGIGSLANSPDTLLRIEGAAPTITLSDTDLPGQRTLIQGNTTTGGLQLDIDRDNQVDDTEFTVRIDGTRRMTLTDDGNLGINTGTPAQKLHVYESAISPQGGGKPSSVAVLAARSHNVNEGPSLDFASVWAGLSTYQPTGDSDGWVVGRIAGVYDNTTGNGGALTFYTTEGTSAQGGANYANLQERMRINPRGHVTMPYQPAFYATFNGTGNSSGGYIDTYQSPLVNVGNHFNATTGIFTAPVAGNYVFTGAVMGHNVTTYSWWRFYKNSSSWGSYHHTHVDAGEGYRHSSGTAIMSMSANDTCRIYMGANAPYPTGGDNAPWSSFSGYLIG